MDIEQSYHSTCRADRSTLVLSVQRLGARSETEKRLSAVKQGDDVTVQEQLARLEEDIRQQDMILAGYEKDNEQLRGEVKRLRAANRANEERMFHENHKLKTQLANLQLVTSSHFTRIMPPKECSTRTTNSRPNLPTSS